MKIGRRQILKALAACAAGGAAGLSGVGRQGRLRRLLAQTAPPPAARDQKPRFLIVLAGLGGASIIDSFLAIRESESANAQTINAFPDHEVKHIAGSPLRAVDLQRETIGAEIPLPFQTRQSAFVSRHKQDMMVVTSTGTSVNHIVAQKRSLTGNGAWSGRTLQEMVALAYGEGYLAPNINMSAMGYLEHGDDPSLPSYCYNEAVAQPALWPLSLDGTRGIRDAPARELVDLARSVRDERLDPASPFYRTFQRSERLQRWLRQRGLQPEIEARDLITKLNVFSGSAQGSLDDYGLAPSPDTGRIRETLPGLLGDPLDAQAALAFLLLKYRVSVTVTISPTFNVVVPPAGNMPNLPLAFDFSHNAHRATQAVMWQRLLDLADRLIALLSAEELDPATGESFWDRTLIYVATDFGRSRNRTDGADVFSSGHHLNNGNLVISPLVNGNTVLGGVNPDTGLTYGFDPRTGAPDPGRHMTEAEIYAGILQALGVSTTGSGLPDMPAMRRNG